MKAQGEMRKRVKLTPHSGNPAGKVACAAASAAEAPTRIADVFILIDISRSRLAVLGVLGKNSGTKSMIKKIGAKKCES